MATFNRAKVANATGTATTGTLTLGATSPGYSDLSKYNTRNDVPYLITWDGGYELGIGTVSLTASTYYLARTKVLENSSGTYVALQVPAQAEIAVTNLFHTAVALGSPGSTPSPPKASGSGALAIGPYCTASGLVSTATGSGATASGSNSLALGSGPTAGGTSSIAAGSNASAAAESSIAIGGAASAGVNGTAGVAVGSNASVTNENAVAIGLYAKALTSNSVAIGRLALTQTFGSVAIGWGANATKYGAIAIGESELATLAPKQIAIGGTLAFVFQMSTTAQTPTPVTVFGTTYVVIPTKELWRIKITLVAGARNDTSPYVPVAGATYSIDCLATSTGIVAGGAVVTDMSFGGFGGVASFEVTATGQIKAYGTGHNESTTTTWKAELRIVRIDPSV